jgi:hypothetical protein
MPSDLPILLAVSVRDDEVVAAESPAEDGGRPGVVFS